jgi:hypothetical protein
VFSGSRFPFRAYFDRSDSRASGSIIAQDYVNNRMGLSQNYQTEDGIGSGNFMFDRSTVETTGGQKDSVTALSGAYSTQTGIWQHNFGGRYSLGEREKTKESASLLGFNSSHNANFSDTTNLNVQVNYSDSDIRSALPALGLYANRGSFLQAYTYGSWMPEFEDIDDLPLTLNGSARFTNQETNFGSSKVSAQSLGANLAALYRFSRNFTASANTAMNYVVVQAGEANLIPQVGSNLNYVGDPRSFGDVAYSWNVGGNSTWQGQNGNIPASTMLGIQASHSFSRQFAVTTGQTASVSFSQSINAAESQSVGGTESFSNNFGVNYGVYLGDRFSGSVTGMLSDVSTTGYNEQHYQNMNLGFSGQGQLTQQQSLNFNMFFYWSDQTLPTVNVFGAPQAVNTQRMTLNGSANYSHARFAGVRGLRYEFIFAADTRLRDERLYGDFNATATADRARYTLTNRLDYAVGLMNFRLSATQNDVGGKKNALLFLQVTRSIGSN